MLNFMINKAIAILACSKLKRTKGIKAKQAKFPNKTIKPIN